MMLKEGKGKSIVEPMQLIESATCPKRNRPHPRMLATARCSKNNYSIKNLEEYMGDATKPSFR